MPRASARPSRSADHASPPATWSLASLADRRFRLLPAVGEDGVELRAIGVACSPQLRDGFVRALAGFVSKPARVLLERRHGGVDFQQSFPRPFDGYVGTERVGLRLHE